MISPGKGAGASRTGVVLGYIQEGVLSGRLAGGSQLPTEDELARELHISRTPVREAIKILEAIGVVEIRRGVGTFVCVEATVALSQLVLFQGLLRNTSPKELAETRFMVERTAAELAARNRTDEQLQRISDANEQLKDLARRDADLDDLAAADIAFHHAIYDACGNQLVAALARFVTGLLEPLIRESLRREGGEKAAINHDLVYRMISARNEGGARESSALAVAPGLEHWQHSLERTSG